MELYRPFKLIIPNDINQVYVFDSLRIDSGFGQKLMHYVRKQAEDRGCA
jgi:hypothetical protein